MGEKAQGIIMYTPDGYMSAQLMTPRRRSFASGDWFKSTPSEFAEEASGYIAYSGPFHVDEARRALNHSMNVSLFPGFYKVPLVPRGSSRPSWLSRTGEAG
jgi:hypothetical protein